MSKDEFTETPYAASFGPVPAQFNQEYSPTPPAEAASDFNQGQNGFTGPRGSEYAHGPQAAQGPQGALLVPAMDNTTTAEPSEPSAEPSEPSEETQGGPHGGPHGGLQGVPQGAHGVPQGPQGGPQGAYAARSTPQPPHVVMDDTTNAGMAAIDNLQKIAITDHTGWDEGVQSAVNELRSIQLKWLELEAERKVLVKPLTAAQGGYTRGVKRRGRARGRRRGRWRGV